ncbi:hypothetical protein ULG90_15645 [Halopseudomonas pachastrellae]|nr:hypothetical protein ULG90_15645 [Halopseudomonas pachastrellae]
MAFVWLTLPWQFANGGLHWHAAGLEATLQISLRCNAAGLLCIALLSGIAPAAWQPLRRAWACRPSWRDCWP